MTEDFISMIYSTGLYPRITRLSRIISHYATLIDNIFTNSMKTNAERGLLYNISDHLPEFIVFHRDY